PRLRVGAFGAAIGSECHSALCRKRLATVLLHRRNSPFCRCHPGSRADHRCGAGRRLLVFEDQVRILAASNASVMAFCFWLTSRIVFISVCTVAWLYSASAVPE